MNLTRAFYLTYLVIYVGFLLHRSERPALLWYSPRYLVILVLLAAPFAIPAACARWRKRHGIGTREIVLSLAPAIILLVVGYLCAMQVYYYRQVHPFDPFLQVPPVRPPAPGGPAGLRVLALGGSTTQCPELPELSKYPAQLQHKLASRRGQGQVVVLNAGRTWYTSRHSLVNYVTLYQDWTPDVVVVMNVVNDVVRSFSPEPFALGPYDDLYAHYYGAAYAGARPPTFEAFWLRRVAPLPLWSYWYSEVIPPFREVDYPVERYVAMPAFERNTRLLVSAARRNGSRVVLATEATLYKANMEERERRALWFPRDLCNTRRSLGRYDVPSVESLRRAMAAFNDRLRAIARDEGVALADVEAAIPKSLAHFVDDCHLTEAGAGLAASAVAEAVATVERHATSSGDTSPLPAGRPRDHPPPP